MNFKKRINDSWVDTPNYIHKTDTDTFTTLPAVLYPTGSTATVGLKGNTVQSGTPTPDTPIMPQGTGERTGNLFDGVIEVGGLDANTGAETEQTGRRRSEYIEIEGNTNYNLSRTITATTSNLWVLFYDVNKGYISDSNKGTGAADFTVLSPANAKYLRWYVTANGSYDNLMIIEGSIAPSSYIPYGYKIPISSANTTTPVYLGEVETERKIQKLVLTGQENNWTYSAEYTRFTITIPNAYNTGVRTDETPCTHYVSIHDGRPIGDVPNNSVYTAPSAGLVYLSIKNTAYTALETWKQFLTDEYAAGHPVTVYYVLATPTTGVVNEPLMKIGDYADTVSGITIPTISGGDSFDVQTTLKPSEVSLTYTGWHDAMVKEWDGSQWQ